MTIRVFVVISDIGQLASRELFDTIISNCRIHIPFDAQRAEPRKPSSSEPQGGRR
jgi:hypothetical protein